MKTMKKNLPLISFLLIWGSELLLIAFANLLVYAAVQQNYRQSADDPQIELAQDLSSLLSTGQATPTQFAGSWQKIDFSKSLTTFLIIYDSKGQVLASSGVIGNQVPTMPKGVFENSIFDSIKNKGEHRFTWQPTDDTRVAAVVDKFTQGNQSGFVLAGRNIREVEIRENKLLLICFAAGALAAVGTFVLTGLLFLFKKGQVA